ncbi:hypothetical protein Hdeb2414_s0001g00010201 [Helianthus debilis subsp. tardiflorus]
MHGDGPEGAAMVAVLRSVRPQFSSRLCFVFIRFGFRSVELVVCSTRTESAVVVLTLRRICLASAPIRVSRRSSFWLVVIWFFFLSRVSLGSGPNHKFRFPFTRASGQQPRFSSVHFV